MKKTVYAVLFIFSSLFLYPQAWSRVSAISIPVGTGPKDIAAAGEGNESWKPLFFDVDAEGNILIPDVYSSRLAVFKPDGTFLKAIAAGDAVSPRMNYFGLAGNGLMAVFNDGALNCLKKDGTLLWRAPFPMFVFPEAIRAQDEGVYLMVSDDAGKRSGFMIGYTEPYAMKVSDYRTGIPAFPSPGGQFSYTAGLTRELRGQPGKGSEAIWLAQYPQARFLGSSAAGQSVWVKTAGSYLSVFVLDKTGKTLSAESLDSGSPSGWTWPVLKYVKQAAHLYVYADRERSVQIVHYRYGGK